jgi:hypothetical protein
MMSMPTVMPVERVSCPRDPWSGRLRCLGWLVALVAMTLGAHGQPTPSPERLNDCTFLREPAKLKRCLDENLGRRNQPELDQLPSPARQPLRKDAGRPESIRPPHLLKDEGIFNEHVAPNGR